MLQYLWLALLLLSGVLAVFVARSFFLGFLPGSFAAMLLAIFDVTPWAQVAVFAVCTVVGIPFFAFLLSSLNRKGSISFDIEDTIGRRCSVIELIDNVAGRGAVEVDGLEWAARALSDDELIEKGETVEIIAVEGVKLICRKPD